MTQKDNMIRFLVVNKFKQLENKIVWQYDFKYRIQSLRVYVFEKYVILKFCGQDSLLVSNFMFYKDGLNEIKEKIVEFIKVFEFFKL